MSIKTIVLSTFLSAFFLVDSLHAQAPKIKYGNISMAELSMKDYPADPGAPALILYDKGTLKHRHNDNQGFVLEYERHLRIKIFSKKALDLANFDVLYYKGAKVQDFKGTCYSLDPEGKIIETKLGDNNIFDEKLTDKIFLKKAAMPAVQEGSVVEFKYTLVEDAIGLPLEQWTFQHPYAPTVWSEFEASIPTFIQYKKFFQGWTPFKIQEDKVENDRLNFTFTDHGTDNSGFNVTSRTRSVTVEYTTNLLHFAQENVPALKPEPFVGASEDYLSQISFDIQAVYNTDVVPYGTSYKLVNGTFDRYNRNWESVGKDLWEDYFKDVLENDKFTGSTAAGLASGKTTGNDKLLATYEYIGKNYQSGEFDRIWKSQTMDNLTKNRKGTPTDLNLVFINLLRREKVNAYPLLISTRSNGRILDFRVSPSQFNRVISAVVLEDSSMVLIDASAWPHPVGLLPEQDINEKGLLIKSADQVSWIALKGNVNDRLAIIGDFSVQTDGSISGNVNFSETGHEAVKAHVETATKDASIYVREHFKQFAGDGQLNNIKVEESSGWNNPGFKGSFSVETTAFSNAAPDKIYLTPLLGLGLKETPFKNPDRKFGIDFGVTSSANFVLSYKTPPGYHLEEAPASAKMTMGENALGFDFLVDKTNPELVKITIRKNIRNAFVPVEEYGELQQFYAAMVAKMAEKIVFSK